LTDVPKKLPESSGIDVRLNKERWNLTVWNITNVLPNAFTGRGRNRDIPRRKTD